MYVRKCLVYIQSICIKSIALSQNSEKNKGRWKASVKVNEETIGMEDLKE